MSKAYVQALTQYLAGSGCLIGSTNIVLTSLTDIYGNAITSITPFGDKGYLTCEPDTTNEEAITFTSVTVNANGTVTLGGVKTVLAQSPYTETAGTVRSHSGGTKVVITDNVAFWNTFGNKNNDETLTGRWGTAVVPASPNDIVNKAYADALAIAGAPNASTSAKGIVQEATQAQVLSKTVVGSTGADLYVNPGTLASTLLSDYKVDTGTSTAYAIAPAPAITAYTTGQIFSFKAVNANTTTTPTLNVNGLGAKTLVKQGALALAVGDIAAAAIVVAEYDGTSFQILSVLSTTKVSQNGGETYAADSVGTDAYAITLVPAIAAYVTGMVFRFKAGTANTGASTLAVNGLTATAIKKYVSSGITDTATGDIVANQICEVVYDSAVSAFVLVSLTAGVPAGGFSSGTTTKDASDASAAQTIAHGLGVAPKFVRIKALSTVTSSIGAPVFIAEANTVYNGSTQSSLSNYLTSGPAYASSTTFRLNATANSTDNSVGVVTVDATNITITWTKTGSPVGIYTLLWEAQS